MQLVELFHPKWDGAKVRDQTLIITDNNGSDSGYVNITEYNLSDGRTRYHVNDINVSPQGHGLGRKGMKAAFDKCTPDDLVTGEVVDPRALKIRRELFSCHEIRDVLGNNLNIDEAITKMESGSLRKVFVTSRRS